MNWRILSTLVVVVIMILAAIGVVSADNGNGVFLPTVYGGRASTPTATARATATVQPTPTATVAPEGLTVLDNHTAFRDSLDALHIVGEVRNGTQTNREFVRITGNMFDAGGQLVDTDFTYTRVDVLAPGERGCFHLLFYPGPPNWSSYQFEVSAWEGGNVTTGLVVTQHSGSFNILGWYELIGMIRNDTSQGAEYVQSIATLYNKADRVVGCDLTFVTADTLSPGESSSFKHLISSVDEDEFDRYRLQTEGSFP